MIRLRAAERLLFRRYAMKKIGLIDYYIDNWHACNLPEWLKTETGGEFQICYGYASWDPSPGEAGPYEGNLSTAQWCEKYGAEHCKSAQEVVEKSDYLMVLSPNNPEQHEILCKEALASGKRTYVDKTFAPDGYTAKRLIAYAKQHQTPMFSSSALRFSSELKAVKREGLRVVSTKGPGLYSNYSIHQIEIIAALLGAEAKRVMGLGTLQCPALVFEFSNGRYATMGQFGDGCPFSVSASYDDGGFLNIAECTNYFPNFVHELIDFFCGGEEKAPWEETVAIATMIEKGKKALEKPGEWVLL